MIPRGNCAIVSRTRCSAQRGRLPSRSDVPQMRDPGLLQRKETGVPGLQRITALRLCCAAPETRGMES